MLKGTSFLAFADVGHKHVEDFVEPQRRSDTLSSVGIGARWQWPRQVHAGSGITGKPWPKPTARRLIAVTSNGISICSTVSDAHVPLQAACDCHAVAPLCKGFWRHRPAGEVLLARGAATAQQAGESGRLLGKGSTIFEGDVVTTGLRSVAVLQLLDGTRITLRPGTKFQIESFSVEVGKESAVMSLFKGGLARGHRVPQ